MSTATTTPAVTAERAAPMPGALRLFWRSFAQNRGAVLGLAITLSLVVIALLADVIAPHSPIEQFRDHFLHAPGLAAGRQRDFPAGHRRCRAATCCRG